ncbi:MAG: hypothetical protein KC416_13245 [Myxococcales bacterium]|nr:hypothetical protein [Myxococcales bacterium]
MLFAAALLSGCLDFDELTTRSPRSLSDGGPTQDGQVGDADANVARGPCDGVECKDDGNICTKNLCNPESGKCEARRFCRRVFVTAGKYSGDLEGPKGADSKCKGSAEAGNLGGQWSAWVAGDDHPHESIATSTLPFHRLDGTEIARGGASLGSAPLLAAIDITEQGTMVMDPPWAWTGLSASGGAEGPSCDEWTTGKSNLKGQIGYPSKLTGLWTSADALFCDRKGHLYCFEL